MYLRQVTVLEDVEDAFKYFLISKFSYTGTTYALYILHD